MNFQEAVKEIKALARGDETWCLEAEQASYTNGSLRIRGFTHGRHGEWSTTYTGAIENMKVMLGLIPADPPPEDGERV